MSRILSLATVVPEHCLDQQYAAEEIIRQCNVDADRGRFIQKVHQKSSIEKRYFIHPNPAQLFANPMHKMTSRNAMYQEHAPKLAHRAAEKALERWKGKREEITHLLSISCTGVMAPGIEFHLVNSLQLARNVQRYGVNFMGCFGAFKGLSLAQALAKQNPANRILLVSTELCSLHMQPLDPFRADAAIANALFADGAAAAVIGEEGQDPLCQVLAESSFACHNSLEKMTWTASDTGLIMELGKEVPQLVSDQISSFLESLLPVNLSLSACDMAIHPGGKEILRKIEKVVSLEPKQTRASWETLSRYGNMSSATILFVLENLLKTRKAQAHCLAIGIGPGLSLEGALLQYVL